MVATLVSGVANRGLFVTCDQRDERFRRQGPHESAHSRAGSASHFLSVPANSFPSLVRAHAVSRPSFA